ncbi:hypothetical protein Fuma_02685 [Fuerstiella marisgermanici]|uniref:Uncharacterized protein n=1 Tax=Fuerstiella marisgermanici TaxID=1891926 RepID=A0A1P8WG74_9PLAN|nr:hypothetical protein Fuma_02685 [Fuerstiella marisgermanici]
MDRCQRSEVTASVVITRAGREAHDHASKDAAPPPTKRPGEVERATQCSGGGRASGEHASKACFQRAIRPPPILLRSIDPSRNKLREGSIEDTVWTYRANDHAMRVKPTTTTSASVTRVARAE